MKGSLYLGKVSGIKIFVHWTFLILIGWIIFVNLRAGQGPEEIFWSILFILAIFACVTLHELGHALTAQRYNIKTRNIFLLPIGGLAFLESIPEKPKEELLIALAGPAVNFVIAAIIFPFTGIPNLESLESLATISSGNFLFTLMTVNVWLALFNLIPAFPMDGGRVFRALLAFKLDRVKATRIAAMVGQVLAIGFVFLGFFSNPFLVFIGLFIFLGAQAEANYAESLSLLLGYTLSDVTMHEIPTIMGTATIKEASQILLNSQNKNFIVTSDGKPVGTLSRDEIITALNSKSAETTANEIMDKNLLYMPVSTPLPDAWQRLQQNRKSLILAVSNGHLEGVVDSENLAEFILIRTAQEKIKS